MERPRAKQVLSHRTPEEFFGRDSELSRIRALAGGHARTRIGLVLGPPRAGKSELLRKAFDEMFNEDGGTAPFYHSLKPHRLDAGGFAADYLSEFLAQFTAFRRGDSSLAAAAGEPLVAISRGAPAEDYLWVKGLVDSYAAAAQSGDAASALRLALSAPAVAGERTGIRPVVMLDNVHFLSNSPAASPLLWSELEAAVSRDAPASPALPVYLFSGLRRALLEMIPADEELLGRLEMINVGPLPEEQVERLIHSEAANLSIQVNDSTVELMIQQLNCDLFYIRAVLAASASRGWGLKTFMEFERVYTEELLGGRIKQYLDAVLREVAPDSSAGRAALEVLASLVEARAAVPLEVLHRQIGQPAGATELLARLHTRELVTLNVGFVDKSNDGVLADYVRARYRYEIAGSRPAVAGSDLLGEKLKHSYELMMSRYNRAVESQLVEVLSRFDFQSVPACLFDCAAFEKEFGGVSRVSIQRSLDEQEERVRLPQITVVTDAGSGDQAGVSWRLFAAEGFEGGIYSEANQVVWLIALINTREPMDLETVGQIEERLESSGRHHPRSKRVVRWHISKEGFSAAASERLRGGAYYSTYLQLDAISKYLARPLPAEPEGPAVSEFELVIPIEGDSELIAARTIEQIARAADFDQESINQIKTAVIEACLNAAEHSDSPDRRIRQRFAVAEDRLSISVSNKGNKIGFLDNGAPPGSKNRGRGLQIIRALMDEVRFEPTDDGTNLVMVKFLKRPK